VHETSVTASRTTAPWRDPRWLTLGIIGLGVSTGPLDSAVNIAFPAITRAFDISLPTIQWVIICYVLTYASLLLSCGRLGDVIGHRRVFLVGLGWSAVSLVLCGAAPTFGWFLLARGLQGVGTALVLSCGPALVTLASPEEERGKILGLYNMLYAIAHALGPLAGGLLVARWGWAAVYYFRVPLAMLSAVLVMLLLRHPAVVKPGQRFDVPGAVALTLALGGVLFAFNQIQHVGWLALPTLLLITGTSGCVAFFIWYEQRCAEPIIALSLFRQPAFTIANVTHVLAQAAGFTIFLLVPYYLLNYYHVSASTGGFLLAVAPFGTVLASPISGWLLDRYASRQLSLCGLLLIAGGLGGISLWQTNATLWLIVSTLWIQGFGAGLFQVANMDFVMGVIPRFQQGVAGSLTVLTRTIGVVSCATAGTLMLALLQSQYSMALQSAGMTATEASTPAFMLAFQWVFLGAAAIAAVAAALMWGSRFVPVPPRALTASEESL
jgi:EmrB/QacA subfamily drug resistance transporter